MARVQAARGSNCEMQLMTSSGSGTPVRPLATFPIHDFTVDVRATEDSIEVLGQQGDIPVVEWMGTGGSFKLYVTNDEWLKVEEAIWNQQYLNQPIDEIRLTERIKFPGSTSTRTFTYGACVLKPGRNWASRGAFVMINIAWRSGGRPLVQAA